MQLVDWCNLPALQSHASPLDFTNFYTRTSARTTSLSCSSKCSNQNWGYIFFSAFNACLSVISKYTSFTPSLLSSDRLRGCWATFILIMTILLRHQISGEVYFDYFSSNWFSLSFIVPLRPIGLLLISSCTCWWRWQDSNLQRTSAIWCSFSSMIRPQIKRLDSYPKVYRQNTNSSSITRRSLSTPDWYYRVTSCAGVFRYEVSEIYLNIII